MKPSPIKRVEYIGTPSKPEPGPEALGLPANPLGYSLVLMEGEKGTRFTLAGDADFMAKALQGNPRLPEAVNLKARRFYYTRIGWPTEFEDPADTAAWSPMGDN
jgi:hypothetical protein